MAGEMDFETAQMYRKAIFSLVEDKANWKNKIDKCIELKAGSDLHEALKDAVIHFTGSVPTFTFFPTGHLLGGYARIQAAGYYAAVGA
jgi:hypothetical protein